MSIEKIAAYGLPIPTMYRVDTKQEADLMKERGLPYVLTDVPIETLVRIMMLPLLEKHYPKIDWRRFFKIPCSLENEYRNIIVNVPGGSCNQDDEGREQTVTEKDADSSVVDSAESDRTFEGTPGTAATISLDKVINDTSASVDPKVLSDMHLLPHFLGDIESMIRRNLYDATWTEGYNKKLRCPIGTFSGAKEARNLIIVDVSRSIPDGISATLLTLLDTMKHMAEADVIVTGSTSKYYEADSKLPSAKWLRRNIGYANESDEFNKILRNNVAGRHFGNVIVFGDYDRPSKVGSWGSCGYEHSDPEEFSNMWYGNGVTSIETTQVDRLVCYHTRAKNVPGYGQWAYPIAKEVVYDIDWCEFIMD